MGANGGVAISGCQISLTILPGLGLTIFLLAGAVVGNGCLTSYLLFGSG